MNRDGGVIGRFSRFRHPRLVAIVLVGTLASLAGALLAALAPAPGLEATGVRLAIVGVLLVLFGASGAAAFAVFERGFD